MLKALKTVGIRVVVRPCSGNLRHLHQSPKPRPLHEIEKGLPDHLKEKRRVRDQVLRGMAPRATIAVINNTHTTETARRKHGLSETTTKLLGRAMAAAALMASFHKGEERVILQWNGIGGLKGMTVEALQAGEIRGFVSDPKFYMPSTTPLGFALKAGSLSVTKYLYNEAKPYRSVVEIAKADVTSDIEQFYSASEQLPTVLDLETYTAPDGHVTFSGGILVQPLPPLDMKHPDYQMSEVAEEYRLRLARFPPLSTLFREDSSSLKEVMDRLAPDRFKNALLAMGPVKLKEYFEIAEGERNLVCQYCSTVHTLNDADIQQLTEASQSH